MDAPRVKTSRGRLLRNNSISENFGHDDKDDFALLSSATHAVIPEGFYRESIFTERCFYFTTNMDTRQRHSGMTTKEKRWFLESSNGIFGLNTNQQA
ncbi:MAG: hypothetical protein LBL00_07150, partial [Endomicrobium sp.]|nr:hypothetical protein [Endomicrobium sp.]